MENLIYILIGIAWVAYSLYSARQKAIQKQQQAGMPPRGPSHSSPLPIPENQGGGKTLFEDIFRELTGEPRPVPQVNHPVPSPEKSPYQRIAPAIEPVQRSERFTSISDHQTDFPRNESEDIRKTQIQAERLTKKEKTATKRFNLREAVIYSELLNRKYL